MLRKNLITIAIVISAMALAGDGFGQNGRKQTNGKSKTTKTTNNRSIVSPRDPQTGLPTRQGPRTRISKIALTDFSTTRRTKVGVADNSPLIFRTTRKNGLAGRNSTRRNSTRIKRINAMQDVFVTERRRKPSPRKRK